jgi:3-hydroxyisobutyrate dehydrogenase-like beta-hydroxyacid dehydrogenase
MRVGVAGVGAMGLAMAGHVQDNGMDVVAFDPDAAAMESATASGLTAAPDLAGLAVGTSVILVMVANDDQTRAVVVELLATGPAAGTTIVVSATNHPRTMIDLAAQCGAVGVGFVDAPVCYGMQGARTGELISLCGGSDADIAKVTPVLMAYSRSVEHIGPVGAGQIAKTCNNMMHWAACIANYETLALAKSCGIDAQAMRETLLKCPARNTTLERWDTSRFTWQEKDMDLALELSQSAGLSLPLFGLVDQLIKRLGPDDVRQLLHEPNARYLGLPITARALRDVVGA